MGRLVKRFGRVVPRQVLSAHDEGEAIVSEARRRADAMVTAACAEAAAVEETARKRGEAAGREEAQAAFTTLLVEARAEAARVTAAAVPAARRLAARMAERIVGRVVELDPRSMADIAGAALAESRVGSGVVQLKVHPDDLAQLEAARPTLAARLAAAVELRLVSDPAVGRAGCVVETPVGRVDARLATQLDALERAAFGA